MRKFLLGTTAFAAVAITAGGGLTSAHAATYTAHHTATITVTAGDFSNNPLALEQFDTNLGNLQSVLVVENLSAHYGGSASATTSTVASSGTPTVSTILNTAMGPSALDGNPLLTLSASTYVGGVVFGGDPQIFDATGSAGSGPMSLTTGLSDWENAGGGITSVALSSATTTTQPNGWSFVAQPTLTFKLDYTYSFTSSTPTPEPASALMLGAGLLALGAAKRRRKVRRPHGGAGPAST
jgi:hypothetical protein